MKASETSFLGTAFAVILIIIYNVSGYYDSAPNIQLSLGLIAGIGLGVGVVGFIVWFRISNWWQDKAKWIKRIIIRIWEVFILAFAISYMFPHFKEHVINNGPTFLQSTVVGDRFINDFIHFWYIYVFFFFTLSVWIILLWPHKRENNKSKENPILMLIFVGLCISFLILLKLNKIVLTADNSYNFFDINRGNPFPEDNPFLFYFLMATFGVIFLGILVYPKLNKILNRIQKR